MSISINFDKEHKEHLGDQLRKFQNILANVLEYLIKDLHIEADIRVNMLHDGSRIGCHLPDSNENLIVIQINLFKLEKHKCNVLEYLKNDVEPDRWYMFRKWYGKRLSIKDVLRHEIVHWFDRKRELLGEKLYEDSLNSLNRGFLLTMDRIRGESVTKLMESDKDIAFSRDMLFRIKFNYLKIAKSIPQSPQDIEKNGGKYFGMPLAGDHHYQLAIYMSHIIAYSFMDQNTIIHDGSNLKLKNITKAINKGLMIHSPSKEAKEQAFEKIKSTDALGFLKLFELSAKTLKLPKELHIVSETFFNHIMDECRKSLKEN